MDEVINNKIRIVHIINGLAPGGAEIMLCSFLSKADKEKYNTVVISLTNKGVLSEKIAEMGVPVHEIGMIPGKLNIKAFIKLIKCIRTIKPEIIQTWMYHSNVIGGVAGFFAGVKHIVWGVHASHLDGELTKNSTLAIIKISEWLSLFIPELIIFCSKTSYQLHLMLGYRTKIMKVVPNGFNLKDFHMDKTSREKVLKELGVEKEVPLVGMAARYDPQKNHSDFILAASKLNKEMPEVEYLLIGSGVTAENEVLVSEIMDVGMTNKIHLLGYRDDMPKIYAALNVATITSVYGEAFPLVVGEAMACEVPCVVTDVGDSTFIIGDTGIAVPPGKPDEIANAWMKLLKMDSIEKHKLGVAARERINSLFSIEHVVKQYEKHYSDLLSSK
jgi:glycosyltransferase involved in cell wall biosynthesis